MMDVRVKDALDHIAQLIEGYKVDRNDFDNVGAGSQANLSANMIKELEKIKQVLKEDYE